MIDSQNFLFFISIFIFFTFLSGSIISLNKNNLFTDIWFSLSGLIISIFIFIDGGIFDKYWYQYLVIYSFLIVILYIVVLKVVYYVLIIISFVSTFFVMLISIGIAKLPIILEIISGGFKQFYYSIFFTSLNGLYLILLLIIVIFGISALIMRKQIIFSGFKIIRIKNFALGLHIITEANLFFFTIYFLLDNPYLIKYITIAPFLYLIYLLIMVYIHFFKYALKTELNNIGSEHSLGLRPEIFRFLGILIIFSLFMPWWAYHISGLSGVVYFPPQKGPIITGGFLVPIYFTLISEGPNLLRIPEIQISSLFLISAILILIGGVMLLFLSSIKGYYPLISIPFIIAGFIVGIQAFYSEQTVIFANHYSIFNGNLAIQGSISISWGITGWFLFIIIYAVLIFIVNILTESENRALSTGIIGLVWAIAIPIISIMFIPISFYLLYSMMIIIWLFGCPILLVLWIVSIFASRKKNMLG